MYRYYLIVMFGGTAALAVIGALAGDFPVWYAILGAFGSTAAVFALDAVVAILVRKLPPRKVDPFLPFWRVHAWERKFYVRIGIRKWKDKIPEAGALLCHFSKKQVADRHDNDYLMRFMNETCYAELMHTISIPVGFLILLIFPHEILWFGLPVALINVILQLLPVFVQRYVRPFLIANYLRNEKLAAKK